MVYWYIEKSLNLICVQVHCDNAVDACYTEQICNEFGTNTDTWLVLAVLSSPTEVGHDGNDVSGRSPFSGINHKKKFHQVVGIRKCALD